MHTNIKAQFQVPAWGVLYKVIHWIKTYPENGILTEQVRPDNFLRHDTVTPPPPTFKSRIKAAVRRTHLQEPVVSGLMLEWPLINCQVLIPVVLVNRKLPLMTPPVIGPSTCRQKNTSDYTPPTHTPDIGLPLAFNFLWCFDILLQKIFWSAPLCRGGSRIFS